MDYFANKVALVSGASRGVGLATARALVERGAKVVITARGKDRLERSRQELVALGGEVEAVAGDIGEWKDAERMVRTAVDTFGRLDILVNNAGISMRGEFRDLAPSVCGEVINTNLLGSVYLTRAAIEYLEAARGHVIFVSSIAGLFGLPNASTYCASKGARVGLATSLRLELPEIHVGVTYLGFTEHDPEKRILAADGSKVLPDRPAHHTQAQVAEAILDQMERRKRQVIMTPIGTVGWIANRLAPGLVEKVIGFAKRRRLAIYERFA